VCVRGVFAREFLLISITNDYITSLSPEIKVWQIINNRLMSLETTLAEGKRKEKEDLEKWIKSDPTILGRDLLIIGEQVQTKSGPLDFLGIDKFGNTIIIELKRDKMPREALAQAIDYASDVAYWDLNYLSEICFKYHKQDLETYVNENFQDINLEDIIINQNQRFFLTKQ